jgi:hypothetical protein
MKKEHVVLPMLVSFVAGAVFLGVLAAPSAQAVPPPPVADPQLARALEEMRVNLQAARGIGAGSPRVFLSTDELDLALRSSAALRGERRELGRLLLTARLVRHVGRALADGAGERRLDEERLTDEDFRFLLGALEDRLARAAGELPSSTPRDYDPSRLRQFRGLGFDDALRTLFE